MAAFCTSHDSFPIKPALSFSIIVPVYNGGRALDACLQSIAAALRPGDEVIVVADGESDGAWRRAPEYGATVVNLTQNGGPARARNRGAQVARGDVLYFVDADVTIRPDALNIIEAVFVREKDLAALIGSYDETPHHTNFLSQYKNLLHHYVHQQGSSQASSFWGACGAIRREIFITMGGFKETYLRASIEDIEFGYRLHTSGHRIRLEKSLQVTHLKRWTPVNLIKTEIMLRGAPWTRLLWRQLWRSGSMTTDLNLDSKHRFSLLTSAAFVACLAAASWQPWLLAAAVGLAAVFIGLNFSVLRFFHLKRGFMFAAGAAFWRFIYDLYSWVGFFSGSSESAIGAMRRLAAFTFARLDALALGVAVGCVSGIGLGALTLVVAAKNVPQLGAAFGLLGQFLPGYEVTGRGAGIALLGGFLAGFVFGWLFATIRNFAVRILLGRDKIKRRLVYISGTRARSGEIAAAPTRSQS
jgi:glycosyltransferase involved in cell wall biosynthesis